MNIIINKVKISNYALYSVLFFSFAISSFPFVASLGLLLCAILTFLNLIVKKEKVIFKDLLAVLSISALLWVYIISTIYSPTLQNALSYLIQLLPLLLLPLLIFSSKNIIVPNYNKILKFYVIGVILTVLISVCYAIYKLLLLKDFSSLLYFDLVKVFNHHPTYVSIHVLTAIVIIIRKGLFNKANKIIIISLFIVFLIALQVKIALIPLVLIILYIIIKTRISLIFKLSMLMVLGLFLILLSLSPSFRYNEFINDLTKEEIGTFGEDGIYERLWLWKNGISQIKEKPIFGYGATAQRSYYGWIIHKELLSSDIDYAYYRAVMSLTKYNLHNQYLQIVYDSGLFGLFIYLFLTIINIKKAIKNKRITFLFISGIFLSFMLTENILNRQMGIYFYSFIIPILFLEPSYTKGNA